MTTLPPWPGRRPALFVAAFLVGTVVTSGKPAAAPLAPGRAPRTVGMPGSQGEVEASPLWRGADGQALPFRSHAEAVEFLQQAEVASVRAFGAGTTGLQRAVLDRGGVSARAAVHTIDEARRNLRMFGRRFRFYHDSYKGQCAAYALARLFRLDNVPPTVCRMIRGRPASVQLWVEGGLSEADRLEQGIEPPVARTWIRQMNAMRLFDTLIFNDDRNTGNLLFDADWKLWMIDHTRAFQEHDDLRDADKFASCSRASWALLQQLTDDEIRSAVREYLNSPQLETLISRRGELVAYIQRLINERGEAAVLRDAIESPVTGH